VPRGGRWGCSRSRRRSGAWAGIELEPLLDPVLAISLRQIGNQRRGLSEVGSIAIRGEVPANLAFRRFLLGYRAHACTNGLTS
jgi:hypothetical protein